MTSGSIEVWPTETAAARTLGDEPVVDGGDGNAPIEERGQRRPLQSLVAVDPPAAVDDHDERARSVPCGGPEIERLPLVGPVEEVGVGGNRLNLLGGQLSLRRAAVSDTEQTENSGPNGRGPKQRWMIGGR